MDIPRLSPKMKYPNKGLSDIPHNSISKHDLYTMLEHNGYELGDKFMTVTNIDSYLDGRRNMNNIETPRPTRLYCVFPKIQLKYNTPLNST